MTSPFDWCVTRRYSDFEWLREILCKQYPGVFVPPIANKTHTRQFSDAYLGKRLKFLDVLSFLIVEIPQPYFTFEYIEK